MQVANSMTELVENDTLLIISDTRLTVDPAQVQGGLRPRPGQSALPDKGPGPVPGVKRDTDISVSTVRDELELEVCDNLPFLDNFFDFGLLGGSSREGVDEANSESLASLVRMIGWLVSTVVTTKRQSEAYPSVLPHEGGPREDGFHTIDARVAGGLGNAEVGGAATAVELGEVASLGVLRRGSGSRFSGHVAG